MSLRLSSCLLPLLLVSAASAGAQNFSTGPCPGADGASTGSSSFFGHGERVCEIRRTVLPFHGQLNVAGQDGGMEVIGEDRGDIALEARVTAEAPTRGEAEAILHEVRIQTADTIEADGPHPTGWSHRDWSVNYRLRVPRRLAAHLHTENGSIAIAGVEGTINAETVNGGLSLEHLAGDVHVSTVNGGVAVTLDGDRWRGGGLFAKSTNGAMAVKAPDHYAAHLVAETVNGGIAVGFPITVQGPIRNHIDTNIGGGGPTLQFQTTNGGVSIAKM